MNSFGNKLKKYISEGGYTVYGLAKAANIERTSLQRTVNNQRLLSEASLFRLIEYLNLGYLEKEELLKAYENERLGNNNYQQKQLVKKLIESLFFACDPYKKEVTFSRQIYLTPTEQKPRSLIHGKIKIVNLIKIYIENECYNEINSDILLFLPPDAELLSRIIPVLYPNDYKKEESNRQPVIYHLIYLSKPSSDTGMINENLKILNSMIPFSLSTGITYNIYYNYDIYTPQNFDGVLFPYYIILKNCIILLSADLQSAVLEYTAEFIQYYRKDFYTILKYSRKLEHIYDQPQEIMEHCTATPEFNNTFYFMEYQPCFSMFANRELVLRYIKKELPEREKLIEPVLKRIIWLKSLQNANFLFTIDGLKFFSETGVLTDVPASIVEPIHPEDRQFLLKELRNACCNDQFFLRIIDPSAVILPPYTTICANEFYGVDFFLFHEDSGIRCLYINEASLSRAFASFISHSEEFGIIYSKENTLSELDKFIL